MAPSGRELAAPKGSLREQAGGKVTQLPEHRPPPAFTATLHGSAHCANALGYLLQAPSEPTYVGPPPSLREALGWGILQVSASFEIRAGGTPHLLPIHYYFLPSKNPGQAEGKVNSEEGISKNPERESVRDFWKGWTL